MDKRPFLKWAGNKYSIMQHLGPLLPEGRRLIEPFVGSAAVFLNTDYARNLLADCNQDLIHLYQLLQQDSETFIDHCRQFFDAKYNKSTAYYHLRQRYNSSKQPWERAALFVYLNKHAYNGLCRYNSQGAFNVPFGCYKKPYFPEKEMRYFAEKAKHAQFKHADFKKTCSQAKAGDVIYCDPPYIPLSDTANFTNYHTGGFDETAQKLLATLACQLSQKGITVIISNHDTPLTRKLYHQATLHTLTVKRTISRNGQDRKPAKELIAVF